MLGANGFVILARSLFYHILPGNERGRKKVYKFWGDRRETHCRATYRPVSKNSTTPGVPSG